MLPMSQVFDPLRLGVVALDILAYGHLGAAAMAARQKSRLDRLLSETSRNSALYRGRLDSIKNGSLASLPSIPKAELIERFDEWVTDPCIKIDHLREFTSDPQRIGEPYLGKYVVWESSGTSHLPCIFVQDAQSMAVYDALEALRRSSARPVQRWFDPMMLSEKVAFVGVKEGHFASIVSIQRLQRLNPFLANTVRSFSIMQSVGDLVEELNSFAPTIIATYPTVAVHLADEAQRGALCFRPKEVWTGGETLTPAARHYVEESLGASVRNSYGASEFLPIGWECHKGCLHVNSDWVILEAVDDCKKPVPPGRPSFTTLLTNLANHVQPLIRYDLGDQITVHPHRCSCGSLLPTIAVQGRRDEPLAMEGCDGKLVTVLPMALSTMVEEDAGIFDFQLRQRDARTLVLRLGPTETQPAAALARCRLAVDRFAQVHALAPIRITSQTGKPIVRGRSGKAQRIIGFSNGN